MFNKSTNSWLDSAESYDVVNEGSLKYLIAYLYDKRGNILKNKIRLHPLLEKYHLDNINGTLTYNLTKEEDDYVMDKLFPTYTGDYIPKIHIKQCAMLTVDDARYTAKQQITLDILHTFNFTNINVSYGYTPLTVHQSKFYPCMTNKNNKIHRNELACGMLDIFDCFVQQSNGNEWMLYFEDDVRPVNVDSNEDFSVLYNVPKDAELIRPYIGSNTKCKLTDIQYKSSFGGGLNHAFYISTNGCIKVLNYAKKYGWKFVCDIDLYKISVFNQDIPTGLDCWSLSSTDRLCDAVRVNSDNEKLIMYHMDHILFNQTSNPCVPLPIDYK